MGIKPNLKVAGSKLNYWESNLERREVKKFKLEYVRRKYVNELWIKSSVMYMLGNICDPDFEIATYNKETKFIFVLRYVLQILFI